MRDYVCPIGMSWDEIARLEERERTRTLGYFVRELQRAIDVRPDFVDTLSGFVEDRNTFVHDLSLVAGFDLRSEEGLRAGLQFALSLSERVGPEHEDQMYELLAIGTFLRCGLGLEPE